MMTYSLIFLWHERQRYLPGILAVTFSALLIALQCGLLLGMFSAVSIPIDRSDADVWVGCSGVESIDLCLPIPESWQVRIAAQPEVERTELYLQGFILWGKPDGGVEMCSVIGTHLDRQAIGAIRELTPEMRARLTEPGAIVVDESERERLGIGGVGHVAEVMGCRLRVVGFVRGMRGLAGAYLFCSLETARRLLASSGLRDDQAMYLLARCRHRLDAAKVAQRLRTYPQIAAYTSEELSRRSRVHWLVKTKAGLTLGFAAMLGLLVGAVVTSQTLYAATATSLREYAVLEALGIPSWRMAALVGIQSLWVGLAGTCLALPTIIALARLFEHLGSKVLLPSWLLGVTSCLTMFISLIAGLVALRSLRQVEPTALLR